MKIIMLIIGMSFFLSAQSSWESKVDLEIKLAYFYKSQSHKFSLKEGRYTLEGQNIKQPDELLSSGLQFLDRNGNRVEKDIKNINQISTVIETLVPIDKIQAELEELGLKIEAKVNHMLVAKFAIEDTPQISSHLAIKYIWLGRPTVIEEISKSSKIEFASNYNKNGLNDDVQTSLQTMIQNPEVKQMANGGKGVSIGFVEYGTLFYNLPFFYRINPSTGLKESRILQYVVMQNSGSPIIYTQAQLNQCLNENATPCQDIRYQGHNLTLNALSSEQHINNVVNIAAGNDYGIAPNADIVFVKSSGGSSDALCNATITLYNTLRIPNVTNPLYYKPWVANYSIATISDEYNGGSRLGVSPISKVINDIQTFLPNYPRSIGAFFVGAGNYKQNNNLLAGELTQSGYVGDIISNSNNSQQFGVTRDIRYTICKTGGNNGLCHNITDLHQSIINLHFYYPPESEVEFQLIKGSNTLPSPTTYYTKNSSTGELSITGAKVLVAHRNSIASSCTFTSTSPPTIPAVGQCEPDTFFNIQISAYTTGSQLPNNEEFTGEWKIRLRTRATTSFFNSDFKYILVESNNAVITGTIGGVNRGYFNDYTDETASLSELATTRNVITVGSTTTSGVHSTFSSIGPTRGRDYIFFPVVQKPDIFAVGEGISYLERCTASNVISFAPCNGQPCETISNCTYGTAVGTSFSTPFAAGTAALLISLHDYNYEQFYAWDDILDELKRVNFSYPNTEENVSNPPDNNRYLRINALKSVAGKLIRQGDLVFQVGGAIQIYLLRFIQIHIKTKKCMYFQEKLLE